MTKRILCAIDVSRPDQDRSVLEEAVSQARLAAAHLDVLTVVPDYGTSFVGSFFQPDHHGKIEAEARSRIDILIGSLLGEAPDVKLRRIVATGSAYEQILNTAQTTGCGLIVIGAHKPDYQDYLLGPNASRVVRHAQCSVYVVR